MNAGGLLEQISLAFPKGSRPSSNNREQGFGGLPLRQMLHFSRLSRTGMNARKSRVSCMYRISCADIQRNSGASRRISQGFPK